MKIIISLVLVFVCGYAWADDYISQPTAGGIMVTNCQTGESSTIMEV